MEEEITNWETKSITKGNWDNAQHKQANAKENTSKHTAKRYAYARAHRTQGPTRGSHWIVSTPQHSQMHMHTCIHMHMRVHVAHKDLPVV